MTQPLMKEILERIPRVGEQWEAVRDFIENRVKGPSGETVDKKTVLPGTHISFEDLDRRMGVIISRKAGFAQKNNIDAVPVSALVNLVASLNTLEQNTKEVSEKLKNIEKNGGISAYNVETTQITCPNNAFDITLSHELNAIINQTNAVLQDSNTFFSVVNSANYDPFANSIGKITDTLKQLRVARSELTKLKKASGSAVDEIEARKSEATEEANAIEKLRQYAENSTDKISQNSSIADIALESIQDVQSSAVELKSTVETYQDDFNRFRGELDGFIATHTEQLEKTEALENRLTEKDQRADELITKAEEMLTGATNAGLAGNYFKQLSDLKKDLRGAKWAFYFSAFLLFVTSLPLVGYVVGLASQNVVDALIAGNFSIAEASVTLGKVLAFAVLMVPPIWLAKFAAARHEKLFRIKEHYEYKYSLAMGVEGFKKQAPGHEAEIAALTFAELAFNPVDKLGSKENLAAHPNPFMERFMRKIGIDHRGGDSS